MNRSASVFTRLFSIIVILSVIFSGLPGGVQPVQAAPTELFFSEYIEGSSNNKALEIYNGTGASINLGVDGYNVQMLFNGSASAGITINLSGTVADGDVFVLAQSLADPAILAQADMTNGAGWFNGDDAVVLRKGTVIIDAIGQIGFDPGTEWGTGLVSTADNTLRRKATITAGDPDGSNPFDPSIEWDGYATNAFDGLGSRFGSPGDTAPTVSSVIPANNGTDVAIAADLSVTFSEPVDVAGEWFSISCGTSGAHTAVVTGGPTTFTLNPDTDFAYVENCTATVKASQVNDQDPNDPPDLMQIDFSWSFTTVAQNICELPSTPIYDIQGSGGTSPLVGQTVTLDGVVTGDFQGSSGLNGFFVEEPVGDGLETTSDGIFVFVPSANALSSIDVTVGDFVRLTGRAIEFNTLTEMDNLTQLKICGASPVAPTVVDLPEAVNNDLERYEGMLVTFPETLTVAQNFFQGRYGQVTLSSEGRLYTPTNTFLPGSPEAIAQADENARRLLVLDDGKSSQNPAPIPYIGLDNTLRAGDTLTGLTGVIDYGSISSTASIRDYRLHPVTAPVFTRVNERTAAPDPVGGNVKVASFNVLNYFTTLDIPPFNPPYSLTNRPRGASSAAEFERQSAKIVAALQAIDADVFGLIEIESNGSTAIADLVAKLNTAVGAGTYAYIDDPVTGVGDDVIKVALIYKPARVTPVGASMSSGDPIFDRQPVAQTFMLNDNDGVFTVVVNHFKSKSSCPTLATDPDADQGDGQGCWNAKRVLQAQALRTFIEELKTSSGDGDILVIGDLNAYGKEDPVTALVSGGFVDQVARFITNPYSYVFDGMAGYLDHALTTAALSSQVSGVTEWHINTDEPSVIDYNFEFKPQDLYTPTPYRSSDHDPVVIGLDLNGPPTVDAGGPYPVEEGASVTLTAAGVDPDSDTLTYAWDLDNNGTYETPGQSAIFSAVGLDGPSNRTVGVQVTDEGGLTAVDTASVDILNSPPVVDTPLVSLEPSTEGAVVAATAAFTDPSPVDAPFTCTVDYGDGSGELAGTVTGNTCQGPEHVYATIGSYTVTVRVTDKDGGTGSNVATHQVIYNFSGFFLPVVNVPDWNQVNAGKSLPFSFSLSGDKGLDIFAAGYPQVQVIACDTAAPLGDPTPALKPGSSSLTYDPLLDTYTFVWKTAKAWVGTCRLITFQLIDGTVHQAYVQLVK